MGISEQIIPAGAVVAGGVLTIAGQALVGRGQRKHERRTKGWQEQRDAYADFRSCARRTRETRADLIHVREKITESMARIDALRARFDAVLKGTQAEEESGVPDDDPGHARRMAEIGGKRAAVVFDIDRAEEERIETRNKLSEIQARFREVERVMDRAASVIDFTASTRVRAAVSRLAIAAGGPESGDAEFWQADQEYVEAVRRELKEWS